MFKYLVAAMTAMTLVGCSFDKGGDKVKEQKAKDEAETKAIFDPLMGPYQGTMRFNGTTYDIRLRMDYATIPDDNKTDEKGQPLSKKVPRATLVKENPVGVDITFDVIYDPATPRIEFINIEAKKSNGGAGAPSSLGPNDIHAIIFEAKGISLATKKFVGDIRNDGAGSRGTIMLEASQTEQNTPDENPDQTYYNKLRKVYEPMVGRYVGNNVFNGVEKEFYLTINMRIDESTDLQIPVLYGLFNRTDDKNDVAALNLTFAYNTRTKQFKIDAVPKYIGGRDYKAVIVGKVENNAFVGSWTSIRGFEGDLLLKKVKSSLDEQAPSTEDECSEQPLAAKWPSLPKEGPVPTPRPKCP